MKGASVGSVSVLVGSVCFIAASMCGCGIQGTGDDQEALLLHAQADELKHLKYEVAQLDAREKEVASDAAAAQSAANQALAAAQAVQSAVDATDEKINRMLRRGASR